MERKNIFENAESTNPTCSTTESFEVKIEFDQSERVIHDNESELTSTTGPRSEESEQSSRIEFLETQTAGNDFIIGSAQNDDTTRDFFVANVPSTSKLPQE